jgi:glycosyltransferase involved in cell wall biosynthesis
MEARVTVVIPVWDAYVDEGLLQAVDSATRQSIPLELIVVDNASRVGLPPIPGAEVVRMPTRRSTGAARNVALGRVRTPYVVFLDADDLLLEGALAALVHGLELTGHRSAYTLSILDGPSGERHRSPRAAARALSRLPRAFALANTVWSLFPTQGATIMRVRDVWACGGYGDGSHGEDWVLGTSLAFRGRISFDERPGLLYRFREDSPGVGALNCGVLLGNAQAIRDRVREDPGIPSWVRRFLPLIALAQWCAARIAHPLYRSARTALGGDRPRR